MFDFLSSTFVKRAIHRASAGCRDRFQFVPVNAHRALPAGKRAPRNEQSLARAVDLQHIQVSDLDVSFLDAFIAFFCLLKINIGKITYRSNVDFMNRCYSYLCQERSFSPNEKQMETEEQQRRLHIMITTATVETYEPVTMEQVSVEQSQVSTRRTLPAKPFPRKYVHSVFVNVQDARQAALALRAAGFDERDIYILSGRNFVEAVSQGQSPFDFLTSMDYDCYLHEASKGRTFVSVRPSSYNQLKKIAGLLAPHRARLVTYIDTWSMSPLLP